MQDYLHLRVLKTSDQRSAERNGDFSHGKRLNKCAVTAPGIAIINQTCGVATNSTRPLKLPTIQGKIQRLRLDPWRHTVGSERVSLGAGITWRCTASFGVPARGSPYLVL